MLIIDEAQNLEAEALEHLRMLSNINADKFQILQLILVGQPQLARSASSPRAAPICAADFVRFPSQAAEPDRTLPTTSPFASRRSAHPLRRGPFSAWKPAPRSRRRAAGSRG